MKAAADKYFLEGSNELIGHGWPYSPKPAGEPGWHFYAAAVFNEHNPWWMVMPDVTRYLQRVSFLLRQGKPANDVALLLPTDDAWAQFTATVAGQNADESSQRPIGAEISVNEADAALLGKKVIPQILDAGFNFDFIDAGTIDKAGIPYPILVLPKIERLPLATYRKIEAYVDKGGVVIATGRLPSIAPGLKQTEKDSPLVRDISQRLFGSANARGHLVRDEAQLGGALAQAMKPDVSMTPPEPGVGFVHRKLAGANLYFFANTTNQAVHTQVTFREPATQAELWNPVTGDRRILGDGGAVELNLEPYASRVVVLSNEPTPAKTRTSHATMPPTLPAAIDISTGWDVTFTGVNRTEKMETLRSWADDVDTRFYSGLAEYRKTIDVPVTMLRPGVHVVLGFGAGTLVAMPNRETADEGGTGSTEVREQAWLDSPVREAARVYVNDQLAGDVWMPPYEVDVTGFLHAGGNALRIVVANLAINEMAGRAVPQHRLLYERYGKRFADQDLGNLKPLPAGILGDVHLEARPASK
jgi:alpha-L-rhamnosidase